MPGDQPTYLPNDSARNVAVNAILTFDRHAARIDDFLDDAFRNAALDSRDRRQATELAYGTCRHLITLNHIISRHSNRPLRRIDPLVLSILRVGLYQLLYLTGTPDFAAIDQAVEQAKAATTGATFVNALLRNVQRDIESPRGTDAASVTTATLADQDDRPQSTLWLDRTTSLRFKTDVFPAPGKRPAKYLSLAYSQPPWLIERWLKNHSIDTVRNICLAHNSRPALALRPNPLRCTATELLDNLEQAGFSAISCNDAVQLIDPASATELPGYNEGHFAIQDPAAQAVAPLLNPGPGSRVLDLCAAPGGKATHLAELMSNTGTVIATDLNDNKLIRIRENAQRLGLTIIHPHTIDKLDGLVAADGPFDAILVDTPCSNTGVLARRVEARHVLKPITIQKLTTLQLELLHRAARLLTPTGRLLYSTCSIEPTENQLLIRRFLAEAPSLQCASEQLWLPTCRPHPDELSHCGGYAALLTPRE